MVKHPFLPLIMVVGLSSSCLDQYKPFAWWKQLEEERNSAKSNGEVIARNGDVKTLGEDGKLIVMKANVSGEDPKLTETADQIYGSFCSTCHGQNGEGVAAVGGRNFQDSVWQKLATDDQMRLALKVGTAAIKTDYPDVYAEVQKRPGDLGVYKGTMMPSGGRVPALTDQQIDDLIKKIRTFAK
ncbi:MAG: cytochrome c [Oligoflexales bacterium]|nr:cytochrome c [Oligoflexales bacterium]